MKDKSDNKRIILSIVAVAILVVVGLAMYIRQHFEDQKSHRDWERARISELIKRSSVEPFYVGQSLILPDLEIRHVGYCSDGSVSISYGRKGAWNQNQRLTSWNDGPVESMEHIKKKILPAQKRLLQIEGVEKVEMGNFDISITLAKGYRWRDLSSEIAKIMDEEFPLQASVKDRL